MSANRCPARRTRVATSRPFGRIFRSLLSRLITLLLILAVAPLALLGSASIAYASSDLTVRVFNDSVNRNGIFDVGEAFDPTGTPNGSGIPVAVYNADNVLVQLANTLPGGTITFSGIPASPTGTPYRIEVVASGVGVISRFGNYPVNPPNNLVSFVNLQQGQPQTVNTGLRLNGNFGGTTNFRTLVTRVWNDRNGNGIQDADEPGFPGVTLRVVNTVSGQDRNPILEATTNALGYAVFDETMPTNESNLSLRAVAGLPAGYILTTQNVNDFNFSSPDLRDSDAFLRGGVGPIEVVVPAPAITGQNEGSLGLGLTRGVINGFIFRDRDENKDGLFNLAEDEWLNGITVELYNDAGDLVGDPQLTRQVSPSRGGYFEFVDLPVDGSPYRLVVPIGMFASTGPLFGAASSPNPIGGDQGLVNGIEPSAVVAIGEDVQIIEIVLDGSNPGVSNISRDNRFGFYQGSIGERVFLDANRNGLFDDPAEATLGIPGVLVFIDDGRNNGTANDGIRNGGELSTTTDSFGRYRFDDVPLGAAYPVVLDQSNFAAGGVLEGLGVTNPDPPTIDLIDLGSARAYRFTSGVLNVAPNDRDFNVNFGIRGADVGNLVWEDLNGDGLFNSVTESGVPGVPVRIFTATEPPVQIGGIQTTDVAGEYNIPNLVAGSYFVELDLTNLPTYYGSPIKPAGYSGVDPTNDALDDNDLRFNGDLAAFHNDRRYPTANFTISFGSDNPGVDAALYRPLSFAGLAFYDEPRDNVRTTGADEDPPIPGLAVQVRHFGADGLANTADDLLFSGVTTAADGSYSFPATRLIPPGLVRVEFANPDPDSFQFATPNQGGDPEFDSDLVAAFVDGSSNAFLVTPATDATDAPRVSGTSYPNLDAGYTGTTSLSGRAFVDRNANGLQDGADDVMPTTEVVLTYGFSLGSGTFSFTRTTPTEALDGSYSFANLPSSSFGLSFTPPDTTPAWVATFPGVGTDPSLDSDLGDPSATDGDTNQTLVGGVDASRDAGFYQYVQVAGRVFFDRDLNDLNNRAPADPEPAMVGVTVRLLNLGANNAVGGTGPDADQTVSAITDANGAFVFALADQVRPGDLTLEVQNPSAANFAFVVQNAGTQPADDDIDSDVNAATGLLSLPLTSGELAVRDAGFRGARTLTFDAFLDASGNGLRAIPPDSLLPGTEVSLDFTAQVEPWLPTPVAMAQRIETTDGAGLVAFAGLPAGSFTLSNITPPADPAGLSPTFEDVDDNTDLDSDGASTTDGLANQIVAIDAPSNFRRSQGFVVPVTITGLVWFDLNANDAYDAGTDLLMRDVAVELINLGPDGVLGTSDDTSVTVSTDADGVYSSVGALLPGEIIVRVANPSSANFAFILAATPTNGSDIASVDANNRGLSASFSVASGASIAGPDAGLAGIRSVDGLVFIDSNGDGLSTDENPLASATLELDFTLSAAIESFFDPADFSYTRTATTQADGSYSIEGLPQGTFDLNFTAPSATPAWVDTAANLGADETRDSDGPSINGVTLGTTDLSFDQGYYQPVRISARVFEDLSLPTNNQWNAPEPGIANAEVSLVYSGPLTPADWGARLPSAAVTTDADGLVDFNSFTSLPPGEYRIEVPAPTGYLRVDGNEGFIDLDPLASNASSLTEVDPAILGTTNVFGHSQPAAVSGLVFFDGRLAAPDNDATGEPPMTSVTVNLLGGSPLVVVRTTTSDATDGTYSFTNVLPGSYRVEFVNPDATNYVYSTTVANDNQVASLNGANGRTAVFDVLSGDAAERNAAVVGTKAITGLVFVDSNGDGQSLGESGLVQNASVVLAHVVELANLSTTIERTVSSAADGTYSIPSLPGTGTGSGFSLNFTPPAATPAWVATLADIGPDASDSDGPSVTGTLVVANADPAFDQGYYQPVTISARVFEDLSLPTNNQWNDLEPGIANAEVSLVYSGPLTPADWGTRLPSVAVTTDADGLVDFNSFTSLPPGEYDIVVTTPTGYVRVAGNSGTVATGALASGAASLTESAPLGETNVFGYARPITINGVVWFDNNNDGSYDDINEGVLQNAEVEVIYLGTDGQLGGTGSAADIIVTLRTATDGSYTTTDSATALPPGAFIVRVMNPSSADFTFVIGGADSVLNTATGTPPTSAQSASFSVLSGATAEDVNAGLAGARTISGIVFIDSDGDGQRVDPIELGLENATIELNHPVDLTVNGVTLATTVERTGILSDVDGAYSIPNLPGSGTGTATLSFAPPTATPTWLPTLQNIGDDATDSDGPEVSAITLNTATAQFDQGYVQPVIVSGVVWFDNDNDGAYTPASESVLQNAEVEVIYLGRDGVLGGGDDTSATITTGTDGAYTTNGSGATLPAGRYLVRLANPSSADFAFVFGGADSVLNQAASTNAPNAAQSEPFTIGSGASATNVNAGLTGARAIAGLVFVDSNGDGLLTDETGLPEASIALAHVVNLSVGGVTLDTTINRTVTSSTPAGTYSIPALPGSGSGTFTLTFAPPTATPPWLATIQNVSGSNTNTDSDGDPLTGEVSGTLSTATAQFDQGYYQGAEVSGYVWFDGNDDGIRQGLEPAMTEIDVELINVGPDGIFGNADDEAPIDLITGTTGESAGQFVASDLRPGNYVVRVTNPDTGNFTFRTVGTDNTIRFIDANQGRTNVFAVRSGEQLISQNAGLVGIGTIAGEVWVDQNADGVRDASDNGLAGAGVDLILSINLPNLSVTINRSLAETPASGAYSFTGLPSGSIRSLIFSTPSATPAWNSTTPGIDSDGPVVATAITPIGFTANASVATEFNQGYYQDVTIVARVFDEQVTVNNNFETGEPGLSGVTVNLDANGELLTSSTAPDGLATFTARPGASFTVSVPTPPASFTASPGNSGAVTFGPLDSGASNATEPAPFGYYRLSTLTGSAWFDSDRDGLLSPGELFMQGLTVTLRDSSGSEVVRTTGVNGDYSFADVVPTGPAPLEASYQLCFALPTGFAATAKGADLSINGNSDINPDGCTDPFTLGSNLVVAYIDAGFTGLQSISGLVFEDLNGDGGRDVGEPGLADAVVTVEVTTTGINELNPSVTLSATSTTTGYLIEGVPPASSYRVVSVAPPLGYLPSTPINTAPVAEPIPPDVTDLDFGFYVTTTVGDLVWLDLNANGRFDEGEPGVPDVRVELRAADNTLVGTTTTASGDQVGRYAFNEVEPGAYSLRFIAPTGFVFTNDGIGAIIIDNDNDARLDGTTTQFILISSQILSSVDAGLRGSASIAGQTWDDTNRNGVRDPGEAPLAGVAVTLSLQVASVAEPITATVTTGTDGSYNFGNLPPGQATLSFIAPTDYEPTGTAPAPFALAAGEARTNVNQGFAQIRIEPPPPDRFFVYLPLVMTPAPDEPELQPDLTVTAITVTPANPQAFAPTRVEVTIANTGDAPVNNFWVDLYINPSRAPSVNERWNDLCALEPCYGIAWLITTPLAPGESRVLNSNSRSAANPNGIDDATSIWLGYFANGTNKLYAYVDSWNPGFPQGAVTERNEDNNRFERDVIVTPGTAPANSPRLQQHDQLPERYLP